VFTTVTTFCGVHAQPREWSPPAVEVSAPLTQAPIGGPRKARQRSVLRTGRGVLITVLAREGIVPCDPYGGLRQRLEVILMVPPLGKKAADGMPSADTPKTMRS
jgi:hypothetical protein